MDSVDIFCKKVFDHLKNIKMIERDKDLKSITGSEYFLLQEGESTRLNFNIQLLNEFHDIYSPYLQGRQWLCLCLRFPYFLL